MPEPTAADRLGPPRPDTMPDDLARRIDAIATLAASAGAVPVLAAYVRHNAPARLAAASPFDTPRDPLHPGGFADTESAAHWARSLPRPRADVAAALSALARLGGAPDLSATCLQGADLPGAALGGARLGGARLEGADLSGADLSAADLRGARLDGADLRGAVLEQSELAAAGLRWARAARALGNGLRLTDAQAARIDLSGAELITADLRGADLTGATLDHSTAERANFGAATLHAASLRGADLTAARLTGTSLDARTDLTQARFSGALLRQTDWSAAAIAADQLAQIVADASVLLAPDQPRPAHWARGILDDAAFRQHRRDALPE